jgi:hypothetical protein
MHPEINKAIAAHGMWKSKFQDFMAGKITLDASTVSKSDQCDFGKWLAKDGKNVLAGEFSDVFNLHSQFHKHAGAVVNMKNSGNAKGAETSLGISGEFTAASGALTRKLMELNKK